MTHPIISFHQVSKSYGIQQVLKNLSFQVAPGEKLALIGPSGSGKTTILRVLMTLEDISAGTITVDGEALFGQDAGNAIRPASEQHLARMRQKIGMVFQAYNLFPHMTVLRNITLPQILNQKRKPAEAEEVARDLLRKVGLEDKAGAYPGQLSGGQRQRVAIARAVALRPKIMLFDEITSALDPELVADVLDVLHLLARETDMTMLLVTHEMGFARHFADRVMFLADGRIVEDGTPEQIFGAPQEQRTRDFIGRIRAKDL